jgi:hypothetical protein
VGDALNPKYLAGLLDGEGCFRFNRTPMVEVCGSFPEILQDMQAHYGGRLVIQMPTALSRKRIYKWTVTGPTAMQVTTDVLPYLKEKEPQARLLLKVQRYPPRSAMRAAAVRELKALKRISYQWHPEP